MMEKKQINLINQSVCRIPECDCGANIQLGFFSKEDFKEFKKFLREHYKILKNLNRLRDFY